MDGEGIVIMREFLCFGGRVWENDFDVWDAGNLAFFREFEDYDS